MWLFKSGVKGYLITAKKYKETYYKRKSYISTGSKELDRLLDYGIEPCVKYLFYGEAGSGKTFILHQIAANIIKNEEYKGVKVAYLDLEGNFSINLLTNLTEGEGLDRIYVRKIYDEEAFIQELRNILLSNVKLAALLIDNIGGLISNIQDPGRIYVLIKLVLYNISLIKEKYLIPIVMSTRVYSKPHALSLGLIRPKGGVSLLSMMNNVIILKKVKNNIFQAVDEYTHKPAAFFKITDKGIRDV